MSVNATLNRSGSSAMTPAQPTRRSGPRRWLRVLVVCLVLAVLAAAGWLVGFSSVFAVRQVDVTGVGVLSRSEVRTAAQVPLGLPLVRQDLTAVAPRDATLRPARTVRVSRQWPRTVLIDVTERTPLIAVRQSDGLALVDETGTPYLTVEKMPKEVVLTDVDISNTALLTDVGVVAAALPRQLKSKVDRIQAFSADGIKLSLKNGDVVVWGSSVDSDLKAEVLTALLKQSAHTYDVSAPRNPSIR